jgi:hypothetical protein
MPEIVASTPPKREPPAGMVAGLAASSVENVVENPTPVSFRSVLKTRQLLAKCGQHWVIPIQEHAEHGVFERVQRHGETLRGIGGPVNATECTSRARCSGWHT